MKTIQLFILNLFKRDYKNYEGVPKINVYLLRLLFILVFVIVASNVWRYILTYNGAWDPIKAAAWCMWGAYSIISFIGIIRPLKMLPIVIFEIIYKVTWLLIVAYPLWQQNELTKSSAEIMTQEFLWVLLPIVAMPWRYFFRTHIIKSGKMGSASGSIQLTLFTIID
jgi:hypothetical protein